MKILHVAPCLLLGFLLLPISNTQGQITVNSVLIFAEASTSGDISQGFASDFDSFSSNVFSDFTSVEAQSGVLLNASFASAGAGAGFDGSVFNIETSVSADQFSPPLTASANAIVEIVFSLDSSYELIFSNPPVLGDPSDPFGFDSVFDSSNSLRSLDGSAFFTLNDLSSHVVGPGNYLLRSESSASTDEDFFDTGGAFVSARLTAVPEPSSLLGLSLFCVGSLMRRRR